MWEWDGQVAIGRTEDEQVAIDRTEDGQVHVDLHEVALSPLINSAAENYIDLIGHRRN